MELAQITVAFGDDKYYREIRCGQGLAVQNSWVQLFSVDSPIKEVDMSIEWPSGKKQSFSEVPVGSLVTVYENSDETADSIGYKLEPYVRKFDRALLAKAGSDIPAEQFILEGAVDASNEASIVAYVSMASWCPSCKRHLPYFQLVKNHFGDQIQVVGVPVDPKDTEEVLQKYQDDFEPAYKLLTNLPNDDREKFDKAVLENLQTDVLPSTILTTSNGTILRIEKGFPTVSDFEKLIDQMKKP